MFLFLLKICPLRRTEEQNQVLFILFIVFGSQNFTVNASVLTRVYLQVILFPSWILLNKA